MSLEIKIENPSGYSKVSLIGNCTIYSVVKLRDTMQKVIQKNENILIDLEKINDFDTAGLQVFVSAKNTAKALQKKLKFVSHPNCVIAILDLYGLISFFGDKIVLTPDNKKKFSFQYGTKRLPSFVY